MKLSTFLRQGCLLFFCFHSFTSLAYEPQKAHKVISELALEAFQHCYPEDNTYNTLIRQRIIQGNIAMDEGLQAGVLERLRLKQEDNLFATKRVLNWHFYNKQQSHLSKAGLIEQSMKELWAGVNSGFRLNSRLEDKSLFLGAMIHLLEDMTVPAHVTPVYHGPVAVKTLGPNQLAPLVDYMLEAKEFSYLNGNNGIRIIKDAIDSMAPDEKRLKRQTAKQGFCTGVNKLPPNPEKLRDIQAKSTLLQLDKTIPGCKHFTWQHFWLKPIDNNYFGRYNTSMNQPLFGQAGKLVNDKGICILAPGDLRYRDFVFQLHLSAIKADIALLYWASQH